MHSKGRGAEAPLFIFSSYLWGFCAVRINILPQTFIGFVTDGMLHHTGFSVSRVLTYSDRHQPFCQQRMFTVYDELLFSMPVIYLNDKV